MAREQPLGGMTGIPQTTGERAPGQRAQEVPRGYVGQMRVGTTLDPAAMCIGLQPMTGACGLVV